MIRRFVNIVAERGYSGMYTLHRLDVSKHLFHRSRAAAEAANKTSGMVVPLLQWLPPPVMRFEPSSSPATTVTPWDAARLEMFALMSPRSCEDRVLCGNMAGHTMLCNAGSSCVQPMPPLNGCKGFMPMTISIARPAGAAAAGAPEEEEEEEELYVMNTVVGHFSCSCFDVLRFDSIDTGGWRWYPLPPPPFDAHVRSHTVVDGGSTICVSAFSPISGAGTYCFDTVKHEWTRVAGDWSLPFDDAAEYVPDLKLWLGFSSDSQQLCAWDLSAMDKPPALKHSWIDLETPEDWSASSITLLNLGEGRFCIAKTFRVGDSIVDEFAVLTGIEMVTDPEEGLKMVRHKIVRYMFNNEVIRFVL